MNPRDFQRLAELLAAGPTVAERRTSIGRAYYAAFNVGAERLRGMGFRLSKGAAAHGEVRNCLMNRKDPVVASVASQLGLLHTFRNRADYQLDQMDIEGPSMAAKCAKQSSEIIRTLDTTFHGSQRATLQAAITQWRRENGYP
jgi:hypothetical protein